MEGRHVEGKVCFGAQSNGKKGLCIVKMARRGRILLPDLSMDKDGRKYLDVIVKSSESNDHLTK